MVLRLKDDDVQMQWLYEARLTGPCRKNAEIALVHMGLINGLEMKYLALVYFRARELYSLMHKSVCYALKPGLKMHIYIYIYIYLIYNFAIASVCTH